MTAFPTGPNPIGAPAVAGLAGQAAAARTTAQRQLRQQSNADAVRRDLRDAYVGVQDIEGADKSDRISDDQEEAHDHRQKKRQRHAMKPAPPGEPATPSGLDLTA